MSKGKDLDPVDPVWSSVSATSIVDGVILYQDVSPGWSSVLIVPGSSALIVPASNESNEDGEIVVSFDAEAGTLRLEP